MRRSSDAVMRSFSSAALVALTPPSITISADRGRARIGAQVIFSSGMGTGILSRDRRFASGRRIGGQTYWSILGGSALGLSFWPRPRQDLQAQRTLRKT